MQMLLRNRRSSSQRADQKIDPGKSPVIHCSREFDDVKEIYRLNHNIVERLRRNRDRLRHVLGDAE